MRKWGGQRGDEGTVFINDHSLIITDVIKDSNGHFHHKIKKTEYPDPFSGKAIVSVNQSVRQDIQRHHTAPKSFSALHLFLHSAGGLKRGSADIMNSSSEVAWYFSTA